MDRCLDCRALHSVSVPWHAVPGDPATEAGDPLRDIRPRSFILDKSAVACTDPDAIRAGGFQQYGDLHLETGNTFVQQWKTEYTSMTLPFVIPRCVSGPDYPRQVRHRRQHAQTFSANVSPTEFLRGFSRRVERQIVTNWTAVPIVRSVWYKYTVENAPLSVASFSKKRGRSLNASTSEHIDAMKKLYQTLWNGHVGQGLRRMPIAGDTTKLPYAEGLTNFERELARKVAVLASQMPGSPQVRVLMGHCHFGARICFGDCLFFTISPNEQHSALVLRLSRSRRRDPLLSGTDAVDNAIRSCAGHAEPSVRTGSSLKDAGPFHTVTIVRNPLSVSICVCLSSSPFVSV